LSLLEVVAAATILTLFLVTIGLALQSATQTARAIRRDYAVQLIAQQFVDQLSALDFGSADDPNPTVDQIAEFFDGDDDPGTITVHQLTRSPSGDDGWLVPLRDLGGTLRFQADFDVNDDGAVGASSGGESSDLEAIESLETSNAIVRIRVFFDDRPVLRTNRALEAS